MDPEELMAWRDALREAVASAMDGFEDSYGYPADDNGIQDPDPLAAAVLAADPAIPCDLLSLYAVVGAVNLPDVGNALFVHGPDLVASSRRDLWRVRGRFDAQVVVFASDGGGTLYALTTPTGVPVYRLPGSAVSDGVYSSDHPAFDVAAPDLAGFLHRFLQAVRRFAATGEVTYL